MHIRTHDKIYLKSNRYNKPQESFKLLLKLLGKNLPKNKTLKLLDIGCATGELIYFLSKNTKNINFYGTDIRGDLLKKAKKNCNEATFKKLNFEKKIKFNDKFDIIIIIGVLSIFDNLDIFFENLKNISKKKTIIYIGGHFNNYDYNVKVYYNDLKLKKNIYQTGWTVWSVKSIKKYLKNKKFKQHNLIMPFDIKQKKNDLMRSWTIKINNRRFFTNATTIIQNQMLLEFK